MIPCPDCSGLVYDDVAHVCRADKAESVRADLAAMQAGYEAARLEIEVLRATVARLKREVLELRASDDWR